jgi:inhibitor of KinA
VQITALGDSAVAIEVGEVVTPAVLDKVWSLTLRLRTNSPRGTVEIVPAATTVTVFYDPCRITGFKEFCAELELCAATTKDARLKNPRTIIVPVCYGGEFGPELSGVAAQAKLTEQAVVALHTKPVYTVLAVGFLPGFPYLGGLNPKLHSPRLAQPRVAVAAGSVGIGGQQTGIYPIESPGGWNLIGRTPLKLFQAEEADPSLFSVGDRVKFKAITPEEFAQWK